MKKAKFKVGDRVKILDGSKIKGYTGSWFSSMNQHVGKIVTIKSIEMYWDDGRISYLMNEINCHWDERGLEPAEMKVIIWRFGKEVHAKDIPSNKEAIAKCNPEDIFDFFTGAKLALERLEELEQPKSSEPLAVGDEVRIINTGKLYPTYDKWVCENIKDDILKVQFAYGDDLGYSKIPKILKREETYIIRAIVDHRAYIQDKILLSKGGACYLIDLDGLERW